MSETDKSSKTEEPTSKKKEEAFKEGTFARSPDISVVFVLFGAFAVFLLYGKVASKKIGIMSGGIFSKLDDMEVTQEGVVHFLSDKFQESFLILLPLFVICLIAALVAGGLQTGWQLTPKVLAPKFSKLNPVKGFENVFSKKSMVRAGGDLGKFIAVGVVIYWALKEITNHEIFSSPISVGYIGDFIMETFLLMLIRLIMALGVIAAISYIYQRWRIKKDLMMTKQEVKDERILQEGNPMIKSMQRAMSRRLMQKQMLDAIPISDVVVTNPTHYAVALKYETGKDPAPMVIAKGQNMFAQKIKRIAIENGVPLVENKPAAQMLFKLGVVGSEIPPNLYKVIAEILTEVYKKHKYYFHRLKSRRLARGEE